MPATASDLVARLDLETIEVDIFRGRSPQNSWKRVFGGQVIAQALVAASRTVEGRAPHSLHGYFILPGDPIEPIVFEVERMRDGRSFTTRRVVAIQHGKAIFSMSASFQVEEEGARTFLLRCPTRPIPDTLPDPVELADALPARRRSSACKASSTASGRSRFRPLDLSRYAPRRPARPREPRQSLWIRIDGPLPDDPAIHRAALAYLSDMTLLDTALAAHGLSVSDRGVPDRQPRPRALVPPAVPRRRMAALRAGQPDSARRARPDAGPALHRATACWSRASRRRA